MSQYTESAKEYLVNGEIINKYNAQMQLQMYFALKNKKDCSVLVHTIVKLQIKFI